MAAHKIVVGFECEFVEDPPKYLQTECPICLQILREPYQVTCCGKSFCKECIARAKLKTRPCPCCKQEDFDHFPNKGLQQPLYGFQVHCSNREIGCEWKGELGNVDYHLNLNPVSEETELEGCEYATISCTYCSGSVARNEVQHHKTEFCDKRPFSCEYCNGYESTYEDVIYNHWPVCGSHPVKCPNKCGTFFHRQNIESHVAKDCPLAIVNCDFSYAGCEVKLPRKDMPDHVKDNFVAHISLLAMSHRKQQDKLQALKEELNTLKEHTKLLQSHSSIVPVDFVVENPQTYTAFKVWSSPHFYSHCKGYKLMIRFTKVSAYYIGAYIMQGEFDNLLEWPFKAIVVIHIQSCGGTNQELQIKVDNGRRVQDGDGVERCGRVAIGNILPYVYNDCLHLRIIDIKF